MGIGLIEIKKELIEQVIKGEKFDKVYIINDFVENGFFHRGAMKFFQYIIDRLEGTDISFRIRFNNEDKDAIKLDEFSVSLEKKPENVDDGKYMLVKNLLERLLRGEWFSRSEIKKYFLFTDENGSNILSSTSVMYRPEVMFIKEDSPIFNEDLSVIEFRGEWLRIVRNSKQFYFCKTMFNLKANKYYSWDEIAETMGTSLEKGAWKRINDYQRQINKNCVEKGLPKLFKYENKEIKRLF